MEDVLKNSEKRILVWGLSNNRAGTEAVIYNYASHAPENICFDFLCYDEPLNYQDLFSGCSRNRYFVIPVKIKNPLKYSKALRRFMSIYGSEYSAIWMNINDISNIDILKYAYRCEIPNRVAHFHNAGTPNKLVTKLFSRINKKQFLRLVTKRWACSESAGRYIYGDLSYEVVPNLVDTRRCSFSEEKREKIRRKLNLGDSFCIGTVGRLVPQKNQKYIIDLLPRVIHEREKSKFIIVGEGELESSLRSEIKRLQLEDKVILLPSQSDMQSILSMFDVFVLPSLYEGLSLSFLEAQFNGLPCIVSKGLGNEGMISRGVSLVSLDDPESWVCQILQAKRIKDNFLLPKSRNYMLNRASEISAALFSKM